MTSHLLVALVAALVALVLVRWLARWRGSRRARRRGARAVRGEDGAADLLERAGYRVVARQARIVWTPFIDDEAHPIELRADYLVETDEGELLVAEVKTGDEAPRLATAATRRQLLEYRVAFDVDGVLLVCPERDAIHRIEFPLPEHTGGRNREPHAVSQARASRTRGESSEHDPR